MAITKISGFGYESFSDQEDFWDDLPVSHLKYNVLDNFQEVFQTTSTSRKSSGLLGSLLAKSSFHNRSERFDLEDFWDDLPVIRLKYNALENFQEVFQTTSTSRKSYGLPGSLLMKSPFHNRSESFGFSDLEDFWDNLPVSRLKYNALDDFLQSLVNKQKTEDIFTNIAPVFHHMILIFHSFKGGLPGSLLTKSSFHNRSEPFGFSDLDLICRFFSDLEDFWDDLPVIRLKYNALDNFQEVFQTNSTSRKSSELPGSLLTKSPFHNRSTKSPFHNRSEGFGFSDLDLICKFFRSGRLLGRPVSRLKYNALEDFQEVFQTTSWKSSDEVFFHIKWSPSLSL
ncbi:hypothetical protein F2Q68_00041314 [Brassica cretica]|uniref:Uncharacterized protein n=1 Tax=Brassica cretica TaxID=69181 RepID=A0A8S9MJX5_BRACR|nr:hypothetical protein F2Q68_00041314 [Brassica cretica]